MRNWAVGCFLWLALALAWPAAAVAQQDQAVQGAPAAVTAPARPTDVRIAVLFIKLDRMSDAADAQPTADVQMILRTTWRDPRLAKTGAPRHFLEDAARAELATIWQPDIMVYNEIGKREIEDVELTLDPDGRVEMRERMTVKIPVQFDLRRFPFDHQSVPVLFRSFASDTGEARLILEPQGALAEPDAGLPEWRLTAVHAKVEQAKVRGSERLFSQLRFQLELSRVGTFYLTKILLPLMLIVVLSWSNFWITGRGDGRIRLTFLCLLAVIAYETTLSRYLPHLGFLTFFDFIVVLSMLSLGATVAQNAWVHHLLQTGRDARADVVDRWGRRLIPVVITSGALLAAVIYFA